MIKAYKYQFKEHVDFRDVKDTLLLAILAAEGLFGEARVRMDTRYSQDHKAYTLTIGESTDVGKAVNSIFTTYAIKEFGRDSFSVCQLAEADEFTKRPRT